jgi:hypothetical protein
LIAGLGLHQANGLAHDRLGIVGLRFDGQRAGVDARRVDEVLDHLVHPLARALDHLELAMGVGAAVITPAAQQQRGAHQDRAQRVAQVVSDDGQ